ncbi:hypothetical protein KEJ25_06500 [Candidatus Bathyarchaeota archaeon]|nr:hypothetical protein [Candidatus Bathyarchaeota archaeon]
MIFNAAVIDEALRKIERLVDSNDVFNAEVEREVESMEVPARLKNEFLKALRGLLNPIKIPRRGFFIVVTGIDKSGKETQCFNPMKTPNVKSVKDFLVELKGEVLPISLPSYRTPLGSLVGAYLGAREVDVKLNGEVSEEYAWILWSLDRAQYNDAVKSWLSWKNHFVLARRWIESNLCYQTVRGVSEERILRFERNIEKPDLILVIDITAEEALIRAREKDRYEKLDFLRKVREKLIEISFRGLAGQTVIVNGFGSPSEVNKRLLEILSLYLGKS